MKTPVVMTSIDRDLFGVTIRQETKESFLNLSDLQEAYTRARIKNGWSDKRVFDILSSATNIERIYYILEKQGIITTGFLAFRDEIKNSSPTAVLKKHKAYVTRGARQNKSMWCNKYIWVLVALELNPVIYAEVISWVTDQLIINRIEAGNLYLGLTGSVAKFKDVDYKTLAKGLNYVVFNRHENGIRNTASQDQLKEMQELQSRLAFAVDMGYIKSFEELVSTLKKLYNNKYNGDKNLLTM